MNKKNILIIGIMIVVVVGVIAIFIIKNKEVIKEDIKIYQLGSSELPEEIKDIDLDYTYYITDYNFYSELTQHYDQPPSLTEADFNNNDYLLVRAEYDSCAGEFTRKVDTRVKNGKMTVTFDIEASCGVCAPRIYFFLIPVEKGDNSKYKLDVNYETVNEPQCDIVTEDKPIIYLYPKEEMEVTVKLGYPEKLLTTYPKYEDEWHVYAKPDGTLTDLKTNRSLYALYWEGYNTISNGIQKEGFVVHKDDIIPFLEEKLSVLGLNEREANEFIIYWLPQLEQNEYNYIRFATSEEIDANMPLEIYPKPDTVIRVVMEYKGLDSIIEVEEQQLETPIRKGFTVVEWGGTKLN